MNDDVQIVDYSLNPRALALFYKVLGYPRSSDSGGRIVVAYDGNSVVGFVRLSFQGSIANLSDMYVYKKERRKGIGSKLLDNAVNDLGSRECYCVARHDLEGFYERARFKRIRRKDAPRFLLEDARPTSLAGFFGEILNMLPYLRSRRYIFMHRPSMIAEL